MASGLSTIYNEPSAHRVSQLRNLGDWIDDAWHIARWCDSSPQSPAVISAPLLLYRDRSADDPPAASAAWGSQPLSDPVQDLLSAPWHLINDLAAKTPQRKLARLRQGYSTTAQI